MYGSQLEEIEVELSRIFLDPNNPRFTDQAPQVPNHRIAENAVQDRARQLMMSEDISELVDSILRNGFLPLDRIVIRPIDENSETFVVVEGNRRVTALKTIRERYEQGVISVDEFNDEQQADVYESIAKLRVLVYTGGDTSDISWILQGIRHIGGIKDWRPTQQAELVSRQKDQHQMSSREVGQMLGISTQAVNRLYNAYSGWKQMKNDNDYGTLAKVEYFTLFDEAISKPSLRNWLGWNPDSCEFTLEPDNLSSFYRMICEDPDNNGQRRIANPTDLKFLAKVIDSGRLDLISSVLDSEISLAEAWRQVEDTSNIDWHSAIARAENALGSIPALALANSADELRSSLESLQNSINLLLARLP